MVGRELGAEKLGASLYELEPLQLASPHHTSTATRRAPGSPPPPTLREPDGEHVPPGDVVCFHEGPDGAHQVRNDGDDPVRVLILSTKTSPDMAIYPDSGKVGVWSGNEAVDPGRLFRLAAEVLLGRRGVSA